MQIIAYVVYVLLCTAIFFKCAGRSRQYGSRLQTLRASCDIDAPLPSFVRRIVYNIETNEVEKHEHVADSMDVAVILRAGEKLVPHLLSFQHVVDLSDASHTVVMCKSVRDGRGCIVCMNT